MKYKLAARGSTLPGWVIQSEDKKLSINCLEFEVSVKTKTFLDGNQAWLEFETENPIIVRDHKVTIY
jgi:hypothetical protein